MYKLLEYLDIYSDEEEEGEDGEPKKKKKKIKPEDTCNRVNWIVVTLNRLVDLHKIHLLWDHLSLRENAEVLERLGWLTVFDPVSPERRFYMDLENREQRVVAACLVPLLLVHVCDGTFSYGSCDGGAGMLFGPMGIRTVGSAIKG